MKYAQLVLLLALLAPPKSGAQNWNPVLPGETQHYRLPGAAHITHSIRIDSVKGAGADSVYYLNRVLERYYLPSGADTLWAPLRNQGQFLGQTMTRKPDGSLVFYAERGLGDTAFTILPHAGSGASWMAVPQGLVTATVVTVAAGTVLGEADSLKTIQFSNGAEWVLSKNHGLVRCPDFINQSAVELSGLETRQLGDRLYRLEDFFDFQTGDVFEFESYYSGLSGYATHYLKRRILEKEVLPDGLRYYTEEKWKSVATGWMAGTNFTTDTTWWEFKRPNFPALSNYPGQLFPIKNDFYFPENRFSTTIFFPEGILLGTKFNSDPQNSEARYCSVLMPPDANTDPFIAIFSDGLDCAGEQYHVEFRRGLGRTSYLFSVVDNYLLETLRGAVVQGDTIGAIRPDWVFTGVESPEPKPAAVQIFPNPAQGRVWLSMGKAAREPVWVTLTDAFGRHLRSFEAQPSGAGNCELDLSGLPAGTHFLLVRGAGGAWYGKFVCGP